MRQRTLFTTRMPSHWHVAQSQCRRTTGTSRLRKRSAGRRRTRVSVPPQCGHECRAICEMIMGTPLGRMRSNVLVSIGARNCSAPTGTKLRAERSTRVRPLEAAIGGAERRKRSGEPIEGAERMRRTSEATDVPIVYARTTHSVRRREKCSLHLPCGYATSPTTRMARP